MFRTLQCAFICATYVFGASGCSGLIGAHADAGADAGAIPADSGAPMPDSGAAGPDSGTVPDAGGSRGDAGSSSDAGITYVTSLTKDGITWTFSQAVAAGQFVTGDYYVVGPVTVTAISPAPQTAGTFENGSVLNLPTADGKSPFDQRLNDGTDESWWFNSADRAYPPLNLSPGDSLVSSRGLPDCNLDGGAPACSTGTCGGAGECQLPETMRQGDNSASPVASMSVLTVLAAPVSPDTLRPSYCDRNQTLYHASNVNRALLPSLTPPNPSGTPSLSTFEGYFRRPWIDMNPFLFDAPAEYMPSYGMHVALADSYVGLLLELNFPAAQKVNLTNYFVQYGIDLYGCVKAGYGWPAFGGHRSGRKMPIVFAGILLGDSGMQNVSTTYPDQFGEDMQTVYVNTIYDGGYPQAWNGATVIYGGHYGVKADGTPVSPGGLYGPYEQLYPSNTNWPLLNGNEQLGEVYRRCCTSISWIGEALAIRILNAQAAWAHQAFFDYADRWMNRPGTQTIPESQCIQDIKTATGFDYTANWDQQGQTQYWLQGEFPQYTFVDDMWAAYR